MKRKFRITSEDGTVKLETIGPGDLELIRNWKNENRQAFFYDKVISSQEQEKWYESYIDRNDDFIMLIKLNFEKIGCIGFRLIDGAVDIYNVILGRKEYGGRGVMSRASQVLYSYIIDNYSKEVTLKVLEKNMQAISWYKKNGFFEAGRTENYIDLKLDINLFKAVKYNFEYFS